MDIENKKSRNRGENWTEEEKEILLEIMKISAEIIENKNTDTNTNKKKAAEWQKVQNQFTELTGKSKELGQLKGYWRRLKMTAKKNVSAHKRAIKVTGGGQKPPSPSHDDEIIRQICPVDFVVEENIFDSDGILIADENALLSGNFKEEKEKKEDLSVIYDCELSENEIETEGAATELNKVITVTDIHNSEVTHADISEKCFKTPKSSKPKKEKQTPLREKNFRADLSHKGAIADTNMEVKRVAMELMKEEYELKLKFQKQELINQQERQKLELSILNEKLKLYKLKNEKVELEIKELKDKH